MLAPVSVSILPFMILTAATRGTWILLAFGSGNQLRFTVENSAIILFIGSWKKMASYRLSSLRNETSLRFNIFPRDWFFLPFSATDDGIHFSRRQAQMFSRKLSVNSHSKPSPSQSCEKKNKILR